MFYNTDESVLPIMDFITMSDSPDGGKKKGMPDMDDDDDDPHRGITETPSQHEELLPDEDEEFDEEEFDEEIELDEEDEDDEN